MMKNIRPYHLLRNGIAWILPGLCFGLGLLASCHTDLPHQEPSPVHLARIGRSDDLLYIDRISNRAIMKEGTDTGTKTAFYSFLVGWQDSTAKADKKGGNEKEKYFQYDMQKDWAALVNGDSLHPVFFQERPGLSDILKEAVMVFELPRGTTTDTIVYKDSFGAWGGRLFVLNLKSPNGHVQD